jgi:hypothetical protein
MSDKFERPQSHHKDTTQYTMQVRSKLLLAQQYTARHNWILVL